MELRIDPEFEGKIPPLTTEEFQQLENNILADGVVINPIIVWDGVIVDGHNRYRIVNKHPEIRFSTCEKTFSDRYEAIAWICKNQLGRRNLTKEQKKYLIGKQYEAEKASHGGDRGNQYTNLASSQIGNLPNKEKTCERIAGENGISSNVSSLVQRGRRLKGYRQSGIRKYIQSARSVAEFHQQPTGVQRLGNL